MTGGLSDRIKAMVSVDSAGCWIWQGSISPYGYGRLSVRGRSGMAHRVSYEEFVGVIPEGLELDHLCRVRSCVNPKHLEAVTRQVNVLRGIGSPAVYAKRTHCARGHLLGGDNVHHAARRCLACYKIRQAEYGAAARAATAARGPRKTCRHGHDLLNCVPYFEGGVRRCEVCRKAQRKLWGKR
jgi:hypothetical protein